MFSSYLVSWLVVAVCAHLAAAETHVFHYSAQWITANPDGVKERQVISFNGSWPLPTIEINKGDRVQFYLHNGLETAETSIHFHGLYQNGSSWMDGPQMVTQCPIPVGETFLYDFTVDQSGTYWYHSHSGSQYSDGMRGLFIVHDKEVESALGYDEEINVSLSDWYHATSGELVKMQLTRYNPTGSEPIPQNMLFMDSRNVSVNIEADKTYLLRIANIGIMVSQYFFIEDHEFEIVEVDGTYVQPQTASMIYLTVGQRASILLKAKSAKEIEKNFCIVTSFDTDMLDTVPDDLEITSINYLIYDDKLPIPTPKKEFYDIDSYEPFDDFNLIPTGEFEVLPDPDHRIEVVLSMQNLGDGINYAFFNNHTYVAPEVPTLYSVFSSPDEYINNVKIYGSNTNSYILNPGEVVEIVVNNEDDNAHPFHLHGHSFQAIARSAGYDDPVHYDPEDSTLEIPEYPAMRDTMYVKGNGYLVLRFKADNPGVWFFHCHLDFHLEQGLALTLIESPVLLQEQLTKLGGLPKDHVNSCKKSDTPFKGNAAGHSGSEWLSLAGEHLQPLPLPEGFTFIGYVAFAVCTLFALMGLRSIYTYGMKDIQNVSVGSTSNEQSVLLRERQIIGELLVSLKNEEKSANVTAKQRAKLIGLIDETESLKKQFDTSI